MQRSLGLIPRGESGWHMSGNRPLYRLTLTREVFMKMLLLICSMVLTSAFAHADTCGGRSGASILQSTAAGLGAGSGGAGGATGGHR